MTRLQAQERATVHPAGRRRADHRGAPAAWGGQVAAWAEVGSAGRVDRRPEWVALSAGQDEQGLLLIFEPLWSFSGADVRYIAVD